MIMKESFFSKCKTFMVPTFILHKNILIIDVFSYLIGSLLRELTADD